MRWLQCNSLRCGLIRCRCCDWWRERWSHFSDSTRVNVCKHGSWHEQVTREFVAGSATLCRANSPCHRALQKKFPTWNDSRLRWDCPDHDWVQIRFADRDAFLQQTPIEGIQAQRKPAGNFTHVRNHFVETREGTDRHEESLFGRTLG